MLFNFISPHDHLLCLKLGQLRLRKVNQTAWVVWLQHLGYLSADHVTTRVILRREPNVVHVDHGTHVAAHLARKTLSERLVAFWTHDENKVVAVIYRVVSVDERTRADEWNTGDDTDPGSGVAALVLELFPLALAFPVLLQDMVHVVAAEFFVVARVDPICWILVDCQRLPVNILHLYCLVARLLEDWHRRLLTLKDTLSVRSQFFEQRGSVLYH